MVATLFQLKITLRHVRPAIWRRLHLAGALTLEQVHDALQIALGWTNSHLHQFFIDGQVYGVPDPDLAFDASTADERTVRLEQVVKEGSRFVYEYDFGDGWEHDIVVEAVERVPSPEWTPVCLGGRRACPPEDCGGPHGYVELLEILANPRHPNHDEMAEWAPPDFAPERFARARVNRDLRSLADRWRPPRAARPPRTQLRLVPKPAND